MSTTGAAYGSEIHSNSAEHKQQNTNTVLGILDALAVEYPLVVAYLNGQTEVGMGMDMGITISTAGGIVSLDSNCAVDIIIHCARLLGSDMNRFNRNIQEKLWKMARRWRGLGDYPVIN